MCVPPDRTQEGASETLSETRKLGNWNLGTLGLGTANPIGSCVERQVAQVVALVQQPVKAPTAPATADGAPVPADLTGAAQIQSCGSGARRSVDTAITAEQVTAAAKSSATFNAPRISRCGEDASVLRGDAEPPAARAGRALWPSRCARRAQNALRWPCNVAMAFRVRETCILPVK